MRQRGSGSHELALLGAMLAGIVLTSIGIYHTSNGLIERPVPAPISTR